MTLVLLRSQWNLKTLSPFARIILVGLVFLPALSPAASLTALATKGDLVFQAGRFTKAATLGTLQAADLRHATKAENISGLLDLAGREGRLDAIQAIQLRRPFQALESGDLLLLTCLRHPGCEPEQFQRIVSLSWLHSEVVRRSPNLRYVRANQEVGALNERVMHRFFESSGWTRLPGEVGRQGIDGLYVKLDRGVVKDVLIAESKYNSSLLQSTNYGSQMSTEWVARKIESLRTRFPNEALYADIQKFVDRGSYRAVLWKLRFDESAMHVSLIKLKGKGREVEMLVDSPIDGVQALPVKRIALSAPANDYERQFLQWVNDELDIVGPRLD